MEITGNIIFVGDKVTGEGKRGPWEKQTFVVEYEHGRFPLSISFDTFDKNVIGKLVEGMNVKVEFDIDATEYKGRYYNHFQIWPNGLHCLAQPQQAPAVQPQPAVQTQQLQSDGLPF